MTRTELRWAFEHFCGEMQYSKFLLDLHTIARCQECLLPWQRELWDRFTASCVDAVPQSIVALRREFALCSVHLVDFQPDEVEITYGLPDPPDGYLEAQLERFPFAWTTAWGGCMPLSEHFAYIQFCPACRKEAERWSSNC